MFSGELDYRGPGGNSKATFRVGTAHEAIVRLREGELGLRPNW